jgi:hypothetical protein
MSPIQVMGILGLTTGASLLLSEPILGSSLLAEWTGLQIVSLRIMSALIIAFGALALGLSVQEQRGSHQYEGEKDTQRKRSE